MTIDSISGSDGVVAGIVAGNISRSVVVDRGVNGINSLIDSNDPFTTTMMLITSIFSKTLRINQQCRFVRY